MSSSGGRLLVTGGCGFIGANFVHHWLAAHPGDRVVVLDALTYAGNPANLEAAREVERFRFVHGDVRDRATVERLLSEEEITTVVHFAAESHVDRSIDGPAEFVDVNVVGTHVLLEAARAVWGDAAAGGRFRFHQVSTDEVYGSLGPDDPAFTESSPYRPNSPYAATKASADHLVRAYRETYGLPVTISNCSNNYGPYQFPEKLIPLVVVRLLTGGEVPVYGDGSNVRDWLHVEDHCLGIERVLERGAEGETYNIGGECERSNLELVESLCDLVDEAFAADPSLAAAYPEAAPATGRRCRERIAFVTDRPGHDWRYGLDTGRIRRELGFEPRVELEEGLRTTLGWYLAHAGWWRAIMDSSYRDWIERQYDGR